jgi:hypothetical protein
VLVYQLLLEELVTERLGVPPHFSSLKANVAGACKWDIPKGVCALQLSQARYDSLRRAVAHYQRPFTNAALQALSSKTAEVHALKMVMSLVALVRSLVRLGTLHRITLPRLCTAVKCKPLTLQGVGLDESSAFIDYAIVRANSTSPTADAAFELLAEVVGESSFDMAESQTGAAAIVAVALHGSLTCDCLHSIHSDSDATRVDVHSPVAA